MSDENKYITQNDLHKILVQYTEPYKREAQIADILRGFEQRFDQLERHFDLKLDMVSNKLEEKEAIIEQKLENIQLERQRNDLLHSELKSRVKKTDEKVLKLELEKRKKKKATAKNSALMVGGSVGIVELIEFLKKIFVL